MKNQAKKVARKEHPLRLNFASVSMRPQGSRGSMLLMLHSCDMEFSWQKYPRGRIKTCLQLTRVKSLLFDVVCRVPRDFVPFFFLSFFIGMFLRLKDFVRILESDRKNIDNYLRLVVGSNYDDLEISFGS